MGHFDVVKHTSTYWHHVKNTCNRNQTFPCKLQRTVKERMDSVRAKIAMQMQNCKSSDRFVFWVAVLHTVSIIEVSCFDAALILLLSREQNKGQT